MKYFVIFILSFFVLSGFTQDTTFNKILTSFSGSSSINSIIKSNNSYYCLVAHRDTPNVFVYNYGIIRINNNFKTIDSSKYSIQQPVIINNGHGFDINKQDTSFIMAGAVQFFGNSKENGYLIKFNKDLDTLWTKQIAHPDTAYADTAATPWVTLRDVKVTPSGDYLILGNYNHHCQGNRNRAFIIKMDGGGGIIWYKFLDINMHPSFITSFELEPLDTGFYVTTRISAISYLYHYDKACNYKWATAFNTQTYSLHTNDIILYNNDIYITSTYFIPPIVNSSTSLLVISKLNRQTHTLIWERTYPYISIYSKWLRQETIDIEISPNGNIAIGTVGKKYTGTDFTGDIRANLLMLNSNGDSLWSHYYTYRNDSAEVEDMQFNDMVICDDGGILFGGNYYNFRESMFLRAWLVKTDSLGNAPGMFTVGIEENNTLVLKRQKPLLYPNPATSNFNLRFEQSPTVDYELSIYSVSGRLVKQQQLTAFGNEYRVDIQEMKVGVYFVRLESDGEVVYSGKFIKK